MHTKKQTDQARLIGALVLALMLVALLPSTALAAFPKFVNTKTSSIAKLASTPTTKEKKAYKRAVAAAKRYKTEDTNIVVDVSDLKLTMAQARHVQYLLYANSELYYIDTYTDANFNNKRMVLRCLYSDYTITKMGKKLDKAVNTALKRVTSSMDGATKILTVHDYLIDVIDYEVHQKTAYTGLVSHKADCAGYAMTMDLMLRRMGFQTDMAFTESGDHVWNLVKLGGTWYHIDLTWDKGYSFGGKELARWSTGHCHLFLLQNDARMKSFYYTDSTHAGTICHETWWAHHRCTSKTYAGEISPNSRVFAEKKYTLYTAGFTVDGLRYKAYGNSGKCTLAGVTSAALKKAAGINVPASVTYQGQTYKVVGLDARCLAGTRARTVGLYSKYLTQARVTSCFADSSVRACRLKGSALSKKSDYAKILTKEITGARYKIKLT